MEDILKSESKQWRKKHKYEDGGSSFEGVKLDSVVKDVYACSKRELY